MKNYLTLFLCVICSLANAQTEKNNLSTAKLKGPYIDGKYSRGEIVEIWKEVNKSSNPYKYLDIKNYGDLKFIYAYIRIARSLDLIRSMDNQFVEALIRTYKRGNKTIMYRGYMTYIYPLIIQTFTFQDPGKDFEAFEKVWRHELKGKSRTDWAIAKVRNTLKNYKFEDLKTKTILFNLTGYFKVYSCSKKQFINYFKHIEYLPRDVWIMQNYNNCMKMLATANASELKETGAFLTLFLEDSSFNELGDITTVDDFQKCKHKIVEWYQHASTAERIDVIDFFQ